MNGMVPHNVLLLGSILRRCPIAHRLDRANSQPRLAKRQMIDLTQLASPDLAIARNAVSHSFRSPARSSCISSAVPMNSPSENPVAGMQVTVLRQRSKYDRRLWACEAASGPKRLRMSSGANKSGRSSFQLKVALNALPRRRHRTTEAAEKSGHNGRWFALRAGIWGKADKPTKPRLMALLTQRRPKAHMVRSNLSEGPKVGEGKCDHYDSECHQ